MSDLDKPVTSIEDALGREYPEAVASPCNDCPWHREAAPGWLGPMSTEEWLEAAHGETPIACHKTLDGSSWEGAKQCRGAAIFRANVCKLPHNPTVAHGPVDRESVFANSIEFREYHDG